MSEFARGALLGRKLYATPEQSIFFTASVPTEIMSVYIASDYEAADPIISLFHFVTDTVYNLNNALMTKRQLSTFNDEVLLIAQCIGGGIHLAAGESFAGELISGSAVNMSIYGVTATLLPVR